MAFDGHFNAKGVTWTRAEVVNFMDRYAFATLCKDDNGSWTAGARIIHQNNAYLKTKPDNFPKDNLGDLPVF